MIRTAFLFTVLLSASTAAAQEASATVDLGMDAAMPGEKAKLSVVLSTTEDPKIGALQFEMLLPRTVSFVELSKSTVAESAGVEAKTELVKPKAPGGDAILRVDVTAPRSIPQGVLVSLTFAVAKDAPGDRKITLKAGKVTARLVDGGELAARAMDGTLNVLSQNSPVFACFFYMH